MKIPSMVRMNTAVSSPRPAHTALKHTCLSPAECLQISKPPVLREHDFYLITHKLYPGLPEPGSTCHHVESLSKQEVSSWQEAKRSLCNTHRRPAIKNENHITASTTLLPSDTARGTRRLVTQQLQNPAVSLVLIISQCCKGSLGTCSSCKTKWQLCNLSLWHIMETETWSHSVESLPTWG